MASPHFGPVCFAIWPTLLIFSLLTKMTGIDVRNDVRIMQVRRISVMDFVFPCIGAHNDECIMFDVPVLAEWVQCEGDTIIL